MKILMIDSLVSNDYSFWLCRGLSNAGFEVELICPENRKNMKESFLVLPISPEKGRGNKILKLFKYLYFLFWLFFYLQRSKADIVHYQFFRRERLECLYFPLLRLVNRHLFFTAHNILPHENNAIDYYLRSMVYKAASKIIVHSPTVKERLLQSFSIPDEKVLILPAVKPNAGRADSHISKAIAREYLQFKPTDKLLLFFGFIREYKGLDLLLEAFEIAKESDDSLKLLIAGKAQSNELLEHYQSKIRAMKFADSVIFKPEFISKDEVDYYFRAADALAVPYTQIDFSGVLQEAFAYGLPVLATNVGNFGELIEQGINGYISEANTVKEFAKIINLAFHDMNALAQMGNVALIIDQNYPSWQEIGLMSAELYRLEYDSSPLKHAH